MNNYHTHTYRCRHAKGTEEEIVKKAIEEGFDTIGFSEHVPLPFYRLHILKALPISLTKIWAFLSWSKMFVLNGPAFRMPYKEKKEHIQAVRNLKEKYKNQVNVLIGFECEYLEDYLEYYQKLINDKEVDYLIFGHHFHKYAVGRYYYGKRQININEIKNYVEEAKLAMQTGLFTYFAHPDLFMYGYKQWNEEVEGLVYELCKYAKKYHIPLELNASGLRRKLVEINGRLCYEYPCSFFWEVASKVGCDVIIGLDVHHPNHLNKLDFEKLEEFAKEYRLNLITALK